MGNAFDPDVLALGVLWYVVFLLSTTCHEAAHALAAKLGGDLTAFQAGQVSLSPLPHIRREPAGMVLMPLLSYFLSGWMFGWASAPYDPLWQHRHPRRAAWMSLAGPGANFLLTILAGLLILGGLAGGWFRPPQWVNFSQLVQAAAPGAAEGVATFLSILFSLNLLLGVFNLMPVPPLDGFSALGLLAGENGARRLEAWRARLGPYAFIGILLVWQVFGKIFHPVFAYAVRLLYGFHSL